MDAVAQGDVEGEPGIPVELLNGKQEGEHLPALCVSFPAKIYRLCRHPAVVADLSEGFLRQALTGDIKTWILFPELYLCLH